jgi:hypothetical protein
MAQRRSAPKAESPAQELEALAKKAIDVARKARKHRKNLSGDNYYANKLAELRADAVNVFRDLSNQSAGDVSAMAEMIEAVFAAGTAAKDRASVSRDLIFSLKTTWKQSDSGEDLEQVDLFPLSVLSQAKRGYLVTVGRQMNGCFVKGWYDACAVMMRRLLEISIIEAFEAKAIAAKIKDGNGNYVQLSDLVSKALAEPTWTLSRNAKRDLPKLREIGHRSAHGRYYHATRDDIEAVRQSARVVIEEFLHHAQLL